MTVTVGDATGLPVGVSAQQVQDFGYARAADVIDAALRAGLDPTSDPPRSSLGIDPSSFFFLMPSIGVDAVGIKLITLRNENRDAGLPAIQGVYVLFDQPTLVPRAVLDGAALTSLRTPAVSLAAVRPVLRQLDRPLDVVIFGAGPQGRGHFDALTAGAAADPDLPPVRHATFVTRRQPSSPLPAYADMVVDNAVGGSRDVAEAVAAADVIVCATSASTPLFDSTVLTDRSVTIAVGSHHAQATEVDPGFCGRAAVIVEDADTALRECGEIVQAVQAGHLRPDQLLSLSAVARGAVPDLDDAPVLFKGSGMSWQDLVVAHAIAQSLDLA